MGELLELFPENEKYFYVQDDKKMVGVCSDDLCLTNEGSSQVYITTRDHLIERSDLKELMIMWLALNYPDVLKYDEED